MGGDGPITLPSVYHNQVLRDLRVEHSHAVFPVMQAVVARTPGEVTRQTTSLSTLIRPVHLRNTNAGPKPTNPKFSRDLAAGAASWDRSAFLEARVYLGWVNLGDQPTTLLCYPGTHVGGPNQLADPSPDGKNSKFRLAKVKPGAQPVHVVVQPGETVLYRHDLVTAEEPSEHATLRLLVGYVLDSRLDAQPLIPASLDPFTPSHSALADVASSRGEALEFCLKTNMLLPDATGTFPANWSKGDDKWPIKVFSRQFTAKLVHRKDMAIPQFFAGGANTYTPEPSARDYSYVSSAIFTPSNCIMLGETPTLYSLTDTLPKEVAVSVNAFLDYDYPPTGEVDEPAEVGKAQAKLKKAPKAKAAAVSSSSKPRGTSLSAYVADHTFDLDGGDIFGDDDDDDDIFGGGSGGLFSKPGQARTKAPSAAYVPAARTPLGPKFTVPGDSDSDDYLKLEVPATKPSVLEKTSGKVLAAAKPEEPEIDYDAVIERNARRIAEKHAKQNALLFADGDSDMSDDDDLPAVVTSTRPKTDDALARELFPELYDNHGRKKEVVAKAMATSDAKLAAEVDKVASGKAPDGVMNVTHEYAPLVAPQKSEDREEEDEDEGEEEEPWSPPVPEGNLIEEANELLVKEWEEEQERLRKEATKAELAALEAEPDVIGECGPFEKSVQGAAAFRALQRAREMGLDDMNNDGVGMIYKGLRMLFKAAKLKEIGGGVPGRGNLWVAFAKTKYNRRLQVIEALQQDDQSLKSPSSEIDKHFVALCVLTYDLIDEGGPIDEGIAAAREIIDEGLNMVLPSGLTYTFVFVAGGVGDRVIHEVTPTSLNASPNKIRKLVINVTPLGKRGAIWDYCDGRETLTFAEILAAVVQHADAHHLLRGMTGTYPSNQDHSLIQPRVHDKDVPWVMFMKKAYRAFKKSNPDKTPATGLGVWSKSKGRFKARLNLD